MKHLIILPVIFGAALFCGCLSVKHRPTDNGGTATLTIRLTSLQGMEGSYRDARVYVDGRFVGNYEPDETTLTLPTGKHVIALEVRRIYSRQNLPNGSTIMRAYTLKGEECIEVLGDRSKQSLVFSSENLKSREIKDED